MENIISGFDVSGKINRLFLELRILEETYIKLYNDNKATDDIFQSYLKDRYYIGKEINIEIEKIMVISKELRII
jgi:hypothetical protein